MEQKKPKALVIASKFDRPLVEKILEREKWEETWDIIHWDVENTWLQNWWVAPDVERHLGDGYFDDLPSLCDLAETADRITYFVGQVYMSEPEQLRAIMEQRTMQGAIVERRGLNYFGSRVITLCGSMRFRDKFIELQEEGTRKGNVILTPSIFDVPDLKDVTPEMHVIYDRIHLRKILMADEVLIVNVGGYIGEDTKKEIEYALTRNIPIAYLEPRTVNS